MQADRVGEHAHARARLSGTVTACSDRTPGCASRGSGRPCGRRRIGATSVRAPRCTPRWRGSSRTRASTGRVSGVIRRSSRAS